MVLFGPLASGACPAQSSFRAEPNGRTSHLSGISGTQWYVLLASDPAAAAAFYCAAFGWTMEATEGSSVVTLADSQGAVVASVEEPPAELARMGTLWVPGFGTSEPDGVRGQVLAGGAHLVDADNAVGLNGGMDLVIDPWGAVFGLVATGGSKSSLRSGTVHIELATTVPADAEKFYRDVLEVTFEQGDDDPFGFRPMFTPAGVWLGGIIDHSGFYRSAAAPKWTPYFLVGDVEVEVSRVLEFGGVMQIPPASSPFDRYAVIEDPTGGRLGLSDNSTWRPAVDLPGR
jgi:predicted enzyme related to lactoylglutathione lyase